MPLAGYLCKEDDTLVYTHMMDELQKLQQGMPVSDIAGTAVGQVGRVSSNAFELVSGRGAPVWVRSEALFHVDYSATLVCNQPRLLEYRLT